MTLSAVDAQLDYMKVMMSGVKTVILISTVIVARSARRIDIDFSRTPIWRSLPSMTTDIRTRAIGIVYGRTGFCAVG